MIENLRIVLVNPSHPGNIGSAARAMKTMGVTRLYLVEPKQFPHGKARELAVGADDILTNAVVVDTLAEALSGCQVAIASSARLREMPLPTFDPHQCGQKVIEEAQLGQVALVFGREHAGLTNDEVLHCNYQVFIPSHPEYHSLNLAAAVQVICYEVRMAALAGKPLELKQHDRFATSDEVEHMYQHLEAVLKQINFLRPRSPKRLMPRLRRLFGRVRLEAMEVNILRGILSMMEKNHDTENTDIL